MKKLFSFYTPALCVCTGVSAVACASSETYTERYLEEMVVTSSRIEMPLRQVGTSVSVLTADDIQARGFTALFDVLRGQTAVGVSNAGGQGKQTALRIRGEESYRTLVIIDGVEVSDPTGTQVSPQLQHILSSGIARVEILRGPQGMMYGADAGGVVAITSNTVTDGVHGGFSVDFGRYNTRQLNGFVGAGNETGDVYLAISDLQTDGFNTLKADTLLTDKDGYDNQTAHFKGGVNVTDNLRFETVLRKVEGTSDYDNVYSLASDLVSDYDQTTERFALVYRGDLFNHTLAYNNTDIQRMDYADGIESYGNNGELEKIEYLGSARLIPSLTLVYGIENETESSVGTYSAAAERDQLGYFVELQSNINDGFYVTAGAREDDNDDFGKHTSYRVTSAYVQAINNGDALKFKASYGTGFRAPSLFESAYNFTPWVAAPAFGTTPKEETSKGYDLGVEYIGADGLRAELVYFNQDIEDEIIYDFISGGYLQAQGSSSSSGVEFSVAQPLTERAFASANYTYNDSETISGDARVRRPVHQGNVNITYDVLPERFSVSANWRFVRDVVDVGGLKLDDYETLDVSANVQLTEHVQAFARLENVTDEDYEEITGYNIAGRSAFVGARISF